MQDTVSMNSNSQTWQAENFVFLSVFEAEDVTGLYSDGLIGFSLKEIGDQRQSLFVTSLFEQGVIDAPVFGMEIADDSDSSWIEIGGYDESGTMYWVDMVGEHYHWTVPMPKVTLDGEETSMRANEATLDSGTSLTYIPEKDYDAILEVIKRETECYEYESYPGFVFCSCKNAADDKFPKIGI